MTKPNLGKKHTCKSCETRFFDLNKNPPVCPKCGEEVKIVKPKTKRTIAPAPEAVVSPKPSKKAKPDILVDDDDDDLLDDDDLDDDLPPDDVDDLDDDLEDDEDDDLMEDTSDIGEDNDDMSEVLEHVDDAIEDK